MIIFNDDIYIYYLIYYSIYIYICNIKEPFKLMAARLHLVLLPTTCPNTEAERALRQGHSLAVHVFGANRTPQVPYNPRGGTLQ